MALIESFGSMDDYFKFDLTPNGSMSNAANGLGGQGYLAEVGKSIRSIHNILFLCF